MGDLISRQAAIDKVNSLYRDAKNDECYMITGYNHALSDMRAILNVLPSAQPEIIRCKDCKHYQFADNRAFGMPVKMCQWFGFEDVDDDDFCSRAERRRE